MWIRPVSRIDRSVARRSDAGREPDHLRRVGSTSVVDGSEEFRAFGNEAAEQFGHGCRICDPP